MGLVTGPRPVVLHGTMHIRRPIRICAPETATFFCRRDYGRRQRLILTAAILIGSDNARSCPGGIGSPSTEKVASEGSQSFVHASAITGLMSPLSI